MECAALFFCLENVLVFFGAGFAETAFAFHFTFFAEKNLLVARIDGHKPIPILGQTNFSALVATQLTFGGSSGF